MSADLALVISEMVARGGARAESFFLTHGLGSAYNSPSKGYGIRKRANTAFLQADKEGRLADVLRAALAEYDLSDDTQTGSEPLMATATSRLFISHASADADLAEAVADLLRLGTDLSRRQIICTSLEGMTIPVGTGNYLEFLRSEIEGAALVLPLLTPAFFDSEVCLIEIGAMWGLGQASYPLIVPPVDFARVEKLLGKVQGARINKEQGLSDLHDRIVSTFGLEASTSMWNKQRTKFEAALPDLLEDLASATRVDASELRDARKRARRQRDRARALEKELAAAKERLALVEAAKTQEMLDEATAPNPSSNVIDDFEARAKTARDLMRSLKPGVRLAVYEHLGRDELYQPDEFTSYYDDVQEAIRDDLLGVDSDGGGYYVNTDDPVMQEVIEAVADLLDVKWGDELEEWFLKKNRKRLDIRIQAVWKALHLL